MRAGSVLPERTIVANWPAFDGFEGLFVAGVRSELGCAGPAADAGTVSCAVEATVAFTGGGAGGGGRFGGQELGAQGGNFRRPSGVVGTAGAPGRPGLGVALGAGAQIVGAPLIDAAQAQAQFQGQRGGREPAGTGLGEERTDQRCGDTVREWQFFITRKVAGRWILSL